MKCVAVPFKDFKELFVSLWKCLTRLCITSFTFSQVRNQLENLVTNLQSSKMTLEDQLSREVRHFSLCYQIKVSGLTFQSH